MKFELKKVVVEDVYETIHNFVQTKDMIVDDNQAGYATTQQVESSS